MCNFEFPDHFNTTFYDFPKYFHDKIRDLKTVIDIIVWLLLRWLMKTNKTIKTNKHDEYYECINMV